MNLTLFDLDGTLIATDSDHAFGQYLVDRGWADRDEFTRRNDAFYADYLAGRLDQAAYIDFATAPWRDRTSAAAEALRADFVRERILPAVHDSARALVQRHQDAGDRVAIVTATNEFITRPIADLFGVQELLALNLERDPAGRATGRIRGIPSFREGKIARVQEWLADSGLTPAAFDRITVYSDSDNDLPLLEWATHPVATNPGAGLLAVAQSRDWPILRLFETPQ